MHPGQAHRGLLITELGGDRGEPLIEDPGPVMSGARPSQAPPSAGAGERECSLPSSQRAEALMALRLGHRLPATIDPIPSAG